MVSSRASLPRHLALPVTRSPRGSHQPNQLNLGGTNCTTDAAQQPLLSAMPHRNCGLGDSDTVLRAVLDALNSIFMKAS